MSDSVYPWIEVRDVTRASRLDLGWTSADCTLCGRTSFDNAEPYTTQWMHDHAQVCHPRWTVRKRPCQHCSERGHNGSLWVVANSRGTEIGCRKTFEAAVAYADHKAKTFLRHELSTRGVQF